MTYRTRFVFDPSKPRTKACKCGRSIRVESEICRRCNGGYDSRPLAERFWPKVQKGDGCWIWTAGGDRTTGYGRIRIGTRGTLQALAHRVAWELTYGPVPEGLIVCHHCDNPRCVRPDHLFVGTYVDNMRDAEAKGRMQHGDAWYAARPNLRRRTA